MKKEFLKYNVDRIIYIFGLFASVFTREFAIKDGPIPIYLNYSFLNVEEEIFPKEIKLNVSLSRIEGTMFYGIDKKGNQLIVTLDEEPQERMKIEMRGEEYYVTLKELCGCSKCRYKPLQLCFEVTEGPFINVRCNERSGKKWSIKENRLINKAFPLIHRNDHHTALLWLVNTPSHGEYYPNNEQLYGCIYDVSYNGQSLGMDIHGDDTNKCEKKCIRNICNSGECYETFDGEPFCDCTNSFMKGQFCNSTGLSVLNHRLKSVNQNFKFKMVKIMWKSNSTEIFSISNEKFGINITAQKNKLIFLYKKNNGMKQSYKCTMSDKYEYSSNSTLTITFGSPGIILKYDAGIIPTGEIPLLTDLSNEYFTSMELLNGNGTIDVVYKTNEFQYNWSNVDLTFYKHSSEINETERKTRRNTMKNRWKDIGYKFEMIPIYVDSNSQHPKQDHSVTSNNNELWNVKNTSSEIIVIGFLSLLLFLSIIIIILLWTKRTFNQLLRCELVKYF